MRGVERGGSRIVDALVVALVVTAVGVAATWPRNEPRGIRSFAVEHPVPPACRGEASHDCGKPRETPRH